MQVLLIGGTEFVGRHVVLSARAAGITVTLFNRGATNPELFTDVERIRGDRDDPDALARVTDRTWDAVVDTCGYLPGTVRRSAQALAAATERYLFVSTVSVYREDRLTAGADESAQRHAADHDTREVTGKTYGPVKVACEDVVTQIYGDRATLVRPGVVAGPFDPTDRFTYWMARALRAGRFVVPGGDGAVQVIDARDLADFVVRLLLADTSGTYHAVGAPGLSLPQIAGRAAELAARGAEPVVVAPDELLAAGVKPWRDLPLWLGPQGPPVMRLDPSAAVAAGLTHRPIDDTIRATLAWQATRADVTLRAGLSQDREEVLL